MCSRAFYRDEDADAFAAEADDDDTAFPFEDAECSLPLSAFQRPQFSRGDGRVGNALPRDLVHVRRPAYHPPAENSFRGGDIPKLNAVCGKVVQTRAITVRNEILLASPCVMLHRRRDNSLKALRPGGREKQKDRNKHNGRRRGEGVQSEGRSASDLLQNTIPQSLRRPISSEIVPEERAQLLLPLADPRAGRATIQVLQNLQFHVDVQLAVEEEIQPSLGFMTVHVFRPPFQQSNPPAYSSLLPFKYALSSCSRLG